MDFYIILDERGKKIMTVVTILIGLVALALFVYLTYILLRGDNE
jgi:hypothetical protein